MTKFTKKDIFLLAIIALVLFAGLTALIYSRFPEIDWSDEEPYPAPNAAFVRSVTDYVPREWATGNKQIFNT